MPYSLTLDALTHVKMQISFFTRDFKMKRSKPQKKVTLEELKAIAELLIDPLFFMGTE